MVEEIINQGEFSVRVASEFSYTEFLAMVASARISITNNLSDGVPNTMLEAMALGAFPIQSNTAITQGWIEDGVNGLLTDPTNIDQIASAISRALKDDKLVSEAAIINRSLVEEKLNSDAIDPIIRRLYRPD
jgi:glycosyltransferase involved in cell wall biosynthesis